MTPLQTLLSEFTSVTLVGVIVEGRVEHELRLYIPRRVSIDPMAKMNHLRDWTAVANHVYQRVNANIPQIEVNRAGMCFNAFVPSSDSLIDLVKDINLIRGLKNMRPLRYRITEREKPTP